MLRSAAVTALEELGDGLEAAAGRAPGVFWRQEEWVSRGGEREVRECWELEGAAYFSREGDAMVGGGLGVAGGSERWLRGLGMPWLGEGFERWCARTGWRGVGPGWLYGRPVTWYTRILEGRGSQVVARDEATGFVVLIWGEDGGLWCEILRGGGGRGARVGAEEVRVPEKFKLYAREVQAGIRRALTELTRPY